MLRIRTVEDRVAQMVLRNQLEPLVEPVFYEYFYGYCPRKSSLDAVGEARKRCFSMKWVVEFDIVELFCRLNVKNGR